MKLNVFSKISCVIYLFIVEVIIQLFPVFKYLKYILIPLFCLPVLLCIISGHKNLKNFNNYYDLICVFLIAVFLSLISVIIMFFKGNWNFSFIEESIFTVFPILGAWMLSCNAKQKDYNFIIDCYFYFTILNFLIRYIGNFSFSEIMSISFSESFSPYESELVNIFLPLTFYYLFGKRNMIKAFVSFFLCYISMKRIHTLFLFLYVFVFVIITVCPKIKNWLYTKQYSKICDYTLIALICIFPIILTALLTSPWLNMITEKYLGLSFDAFTLGRENMYKLVYENLDVVSGWGNTRGISLAMFGVNDMHSDILRIYFETSIIGLFLYWYFYFKLLERSWFLLLYMSFIIAVMLISPIITDVFGFICIYVILFALKDKYKFQKKKYARSEKIKLSYGSIGKIKGDIN